MSGLAVPQDLPWWVGPAPGFPTLAGETDVEVPIVGGGLAGVALAWTLTEQGALAGLEHAGQRALREGVSLIGAAAS